jgi:hypothetical protein
MHDSNIRTGVEFLAGSSGHAVKARSPTVSLPLQAQLRKMKQLKEMYARASGGVDTIGKAEC